MLNHSFWKGRRVFLTGHTGFKGSWLSLWLNALGADVTGYALEPPTEPNLFEQAQVVGRCVHSIRGDIRDFSRLKTAIAECRPEVVIHMAAQSVVRRGYEDPIETYSSNVMGTVHLLGSRAAAGAAMRRGQCHQRQVLRESRVGLGLSRERADGRPRSVFELEGLRRTRHHAYRESFFPPHALDRARRRAGQRPRRQCDRRRRLDQQSTHSRSHAGLSRAASPA